MLKMVDGTGIIGVDMICPLGVSTPQPPNYDRVELEGAGMLVLPNSLDAPLERLELGGKTEQVRTSGKQMLNEELLKSLSNYTSNGSDYYYYRISGLEVGKKYTVSRGDVKTGKNALLGISVNQESTNKAKFLVYDGLGTIYNNASITWEQTTGEYVDILFSVSGSVMSTTQEKLTEFWKRISYVQLEKGSTATAYEPYTGGKPSPSPEYPQEIKNSGKWNEEKKKYEVDVKVTGKNLFDKRLLEGGEIVEFNGVECYKYKDDSNNFKYKGKFKNGQQYALTTRILRPESKKSYGTYIKFKYEDGTDSVLYAEHGGLKTLVSNIGKTIDSIIGNYNYSTDCYLDLSVTRLSSGGQDSGYQPYKEQTLTLTSDRPITKWDRLVEQGGEIGWLYGTRDVIFTGDESWRRHTETDMSVWFACYNCLPGIKTHDVARNIGAYSNYALRERELANNRDGKFCTNGNPSNNFLLFGMSKDYTVETFKTWLREKNKSGKPMCLTYPTESTEFVPLPQPEQNAIRALKTYYPTTVITAGGGELDPDIKVTYRKEI